MIWIIGVCCCLLGLRAAHAETRTVEFGKETWEKLSGKHFIIYYHPGWEEAGAKKVLREAENYYKEIVDELGFTRYSDFWTWDQRAKIFIFPNQSAFLKRTGAPAWSMGYSDRDSHLFQSRAIVTYQQEKTLFDELMPHEISHLIVHDFIPLGNIPVWVDEGLAQLHEKNKYIAADAMMRRLVGQGQYIHLEYLNRWDIRREKDAKKVEIFYAQSLSMIRFLREEQGAENFRQFCRNLRDGKPIVQALQSAYPRRIRSLKDLEQLWVAFMLEK